MGEEGFTPKSTATSHAKGGSYKRKKRNMQRRLGYPTTTGSQDPKGRKSGPREEKLKKEVPKKLKL